MAGRPQTAVAMAASVAGGWSASDAAAGDRAPVAFAGFAGSVSGPATTIRSAGGRPGRRPARAKARANSTGMAGWAASSSAMSSAGVTGNPVMEETSHRRGVPNTTSASTLRSGAVHLAVVVQCCARPASNVAGMLSAEARSSRSRMPVLGPASTYEPGVSWAAIRTPLAAHNRDAWALSQPTRTSAAGRTEHARSTWPRNAASRAASAAGKQPAQTSPASSPKPYPTAESAATPSRSSSRMALSEAVSSIVCSATVAARPGNATMIVPVAPAEMPMPGSVTIVAECGLGVPVCQCRRSWAARRACPDSCRGPVAVTVTRSGAPRSEARWAAAAR
jgi:hypothetical protein